MNGLVLVGGFTESRRMLEPVAEAVADPDMDIEILTLREAATTDEERMRKLLKGAHVLTHSAGVTALPDARGRSSELELPMDLMVVAGPEPRCVDDLIMASTAKTLDHVFAPARHRRDNLRVVAGNAAEMIAHPIANLGLVSEISKFSTIRALDEGRLDAQAQIGSFMMTYDVFYAPPLGWGNIAAVHDLISAGAVIDEIVGEHDDLLIDPEGVFEAMNEAIARDRRDRMYDAH